MRTKSIKEKFFNLPLPQKFIGVGALLSLIGSFLPWYKDFDAFNYGVQFLGITGPLYLVGFIIIGLSLFSFILTGFYLFEKDIPDLPMKESLVYILNGATGLFLLLIANSVYFHKDFGTNITSKEYGIGMMIVLIGTIAITLGGILQSRESGTARFINKFKQDTGLIEEEEKKIDPIIELNNFQKEQKDQRERGEVVETSESVSKPEKTFVQERFKGHSGVREYRIKSETKVRQEPYPDPSLLKKEEVVAKPAEKREDSTVNPNSVIRMDL